MMLIAELVLIFFLSSDSSPDKEINFKILPPTRAAACLTDSSPQSSDFYTDVCVQIFSQPAVFYTQNININAAVSLVSLHEN